MIAKYWMVLKDMRRQHLPVLLLWLVYIGWLKKENHSCIDQ
jgi:hypothetical protein